MRIGALIVRLVAAAVVIVPVAGGRALGADEKPFFPLTAWDDVRDADTIKKMGECGINLIAFVPPKWLDACHENGVKAIVYDPRLTPAWDKPFNAKAANEVLPEIIKAHNDHPAVFGYHLKDEPDGGQFSEIVKSAELVRKLAPGKWPYVNLTPGMGAGYITDHVKPFIEQVKPPILSYDNYAIGEKVSFSYGFWANISDIRSAALAADIPFHNIILTAAHWNYRVANASDLRLQIYGSLAYGARGLGYYKFVSEPLSALDAPDLGNFRMAPLDEFHEKTETWAPPAQHQPPGAEPRPDPAQAAERRRLSRRRDPRTQPRHHGEEPRDRARLRAGVRHRRLHARRGRLALGHDREQDAGRVGLLPSEVPHDAEVDPLRVAGHR